MHDAKGAEEFGDFTSIRNELFEADAPSMLENIWVYLIPESMGPVALPRYPPYNSYGLSRQQPIGIH
jgi:hypothetical protein